jgi:hypothetical protein
MFRNNEFQERDAEKKRNNGAATEQYVGKSISVPQRASPSSNGTGLHLRRICLIAAMATMPPAKSDIETGSGTGCGAPARAAPLAIIAATTRVAEMNMLRIFFFPFEDVCYLRRRCFTAAMATMPPAKSDIETGSGTCTVVPA